MNLGLFALNGVARQILRGSTLGQHRCVGCALLCGNAAQTFLRWPDPCVCKCLLQNVDQSLKSTCRWSSRGVGRDCQDPHRTRRSPATRINSLQPHPPSMEKGIWRPHAPTRVVLPVTCPLLSLRHVSTSCLCPHAPQSSTIRAVFHHACAAILECGSKRHGWRSQHACPCVSAGQRDPAKRNAMTPVGLFRRVAHDANLSACMPLSLRPRSSLWARPEALALASFVKRPGKVSRHWFADPTLTGRVFRRFALLCSCNTIGRCVLEHGR